MKFATPRIRREWNSAALAPAARQVLLDAAAYARERWNWEFTLTSLWRSPEEERALGASGIHAEWRAADVRTRGIPPAAVEDVARHANERWVYDPKRPRLRVCVSAPHGAGPHLHFQAHARTARRTESGEPDARSGAVRGR